MASLDFSVAALLQRRQRVEAFAACAFTRACDAPDFIVGRLAAEQGLPDREEDLVGVLCDAWFGMG